MKKFFTKLSIMFDKLKDFLITVIITLLIIIVLSTLAHNIIKIIQISNKYDGEYKCLAEVENGDIVNVIEYGQGDKTLVILPGFGVQAPSIFYKNLASNLSNEYKVVIIEYPGYGFAKNTENDRNNENFANDIKQALEQKEIFGPYILIPHSISNLYAMKFIEMYPDLVEKVISIDGMYPKEITDELGVENVKNTCINVKITSILEYTGFARFLSYIKPDMYYINVMKEDKNISAEDINLYRKMIATNYLSKSMVNEIENLNSNMKELVDFSYSENLPVLEILATDTVQEYDTKYDEKNKLYEIAESTLTNREIQKIIQVEGSHMLNMTNLEDLTNEIIEFVNN